MYPTIKHISLRNYSVIENALMEKRVCGDVYYDDQCIGWYNPIEHKPNEMMAHMFLRIEDDFQYLFDEFANYQSLLLLRRIGYADEPLQAGFGVLLTDLEDLTLLYTAMSDNGILVKNDVGIINGDLTKIIHVQKPELLDDRENLMKCLRQYSGIQFDDQHEIKLFCCEDDFVIN